MISRRRESGILKARVDVDHFLITLAYEEEYRDDGSGHSLGAGGRFVWAGVEVFELGAIACRGVLSL